MTKSKRVQAVRVSVSSWPDRDANLAAREARKRAEDAKFSAIEAEQREAANNARWTDLDD